MWLSQTNNGVLTFNAMEDYLAGFEQKAVNWPSFISSAFPRFHDIYAQAGVGPSYGRLEDAAGQTLTRTLERALTNKSVFVQLVTWNDFGEGTIIEPTVQNGFRDLGIVQSLRKKHMDPGFSRTTNDLALVFRMFQLRQRGTNSAVSAELDRAAANIISGDLAAARARIDGIESSRAAILNVERTPDGVAFRIGGGAASTQAAVFATTDLLSDSWTTVSTLEAGTNEMRFKAPAEANQQFFRVGTAAR